MASGFLAHRRRLWNEREGKWIGWERKRGKLHEFNRLLRGATGTSFVPVEAGCRVPTGVRYVIVLDADTRLPRGAAKRLIGKMAHPLNQPILVLSRAVSSMVTRCCSRGSRHPCRPALKDHCFSGCFQVQAAWIPMPARSPMCPQDLFGEGSYCGKGIYDVDFFEAALSGRIPDNTLLSHDLLEGIFARAGLVSDIEVVDDFPARYDVAVSRQYRWARGDWQLLPWIFGLDRTLNRDRRHREIPLVGRWKMIDNLRRSLSAPAGVLALVCAWTLPFASPLPWSAFIVTTLALPAIIPFLTGVMPREFGLSWQSHCRGNRSGSQARAVANRASRCVPGASGMVHVRRNCTGHCSG